MKRLHERRTKTVGEESDKDRPDHGDHPSQIDLFRSEPLGGPPVDHQTDDTSSATTVRESALPLCGNVTGPVRCGLSESTEEGGVAVEGSDDDDVVTCSIAEN
jgi:hypothetical protein